MIIHIMSRGKILLEKKFFRFKLLLKHKGGKMPSLEDIRTYLKEEIERNGFSFRDISLKIGRKDSYIQQYIKYGFPKRLSEIDRKKIALMLNIDEKELIDEELSEVIEELSRGGLI